MQCPCVPLTLTPGRRVDGSDNFACKSKRNEVVIYLFTNFEPIERFKLTA